MNFEKKKVLLELVLSQIDKEKKDQIDKKRRLAKLHHNKIVPIKAQKNRKLPTT